MIHHRGSSKLLILQTISMKIFIENFSVKITLFEITGTPWQWLCALFYNVRYGLRCYLFGRPIFEQQAQELRERALRKRDRGFGRLNANMQNEADSTSDNP